jgi:uncharacterized membrane protein YphA (DoxX/SURF4 family)
MPFSLRYPHGFIRFSIALAFFWFGLDKFTDPQRWIDTFPHALASVAATAHLGVRDLIFLSGIAEVLIGLSLATGFFLRWFAGGAIVFVLLAAMTHGYGDALIRDIVVIGGLAALATWPERNYF